MNITENLPDLIKLQPLFKRVLGEPKDDDFIYYDNKRMPYYIFKQEYYAEVYYVRIPTLEELIKMLGEFRLLKTHTFWGKPICQITRLETSVGEAGELIGEADNPYTALLKALVSQEGLQTWTCGGRHKTETGRK